jgi:spore coat protein A
MLSRRRLLRSAAAAAVLAPLGLRLSGAASAAGTRPAAFTTPLRIPRVLVSRAGADGDHYELTARAATADVWPGSATPVWGYDGAFPGPTIVAQRGRPVTVLHRNALDVPAAVHLHGGHVPPDMDGHALDVIPPGGERLYRYPNNQPGATLWYHDHAMHATGRNLHNGLFGLYLVHDPAEDALGLPSGDRDIPLIVADRTFDAAGRMVYPEHAHDGFLGDTPLVNGVVQPHLAVDRTIYRFRLVNASNARRYDLGLQAASGAPLSFTQIASDGGLLRAPIVRERVQLSPGERIEVLVDFAALADGGRVLLAGRGSGAIAQLLRFDVGAAAPVRAAVPPSLAQVAPLTGAVLTRKVTLGETDGVWQLMGHSFDPDVVDFRPRLAATEIWSFHNPTGQAHPMHLHLVQFQVLDRDGVPAPAWERGWKDTVFVNAAETVRVVARFTDWTGTYIYHCHNLEHEDHDMMSQFRVVDVPRVAGPGRFATACAASARAYPDGAPVAIVATAGDFPDALAGGAAAAALGGPILLVERDRLPDETAAELRRLRPQRVIVLGGLRAVSAGIEQQLRAFAGALERVAGESRYATAAALSRRVFSGAVPTVYVATGSGFADALAGGAAAAAAGAPLLLAARDEVPEATAAELRRLSAARIVVLGGRSAISDATLGVLEGLAREGAERVSGDSRYATAAAVAAHAWPTGAATAYVATGGGFADALAGVPAAARDKAPLLLVDRDTVPAATAAELRRLGPERIVILGGTSTISEQTADALTAFVRG